MVKQAEPTPNPNAMKFTVGHALEGPRTYVAGQEHDDPLVDELLAVGGVTSIFMVSDFVTVTKAPDGDWSVIEPAARDILTRHLG